MQFTTKTILDHGNNLLRIPRAKLLFGGEELENYYIPSIYGSIKLTPNFLFYFLELESTMPKWYVVRFGSTGDPRGAGMGTP